MRQDNLPPHEPELEAGVLGALILEPHRLNSVSFLLDEGSFYVEKHALIWRALKALQKARVSPDLLTLLAELKRQGTAEKVGGAFGLAEITNKVASAVNIETYVRILSQYRTSRELIKVGHKLQAKGFESGENGLEALGWAQAQLRDLSSGVFKRSARPLSQAWERTIQELSAPGDTGRVITGLRDLDRKAGALEPGTMTIIGARPGMGKTILGLEIALANAKIGNRVAFFSLEMPENQLTQRILSRELEIPLSRLRARDLSSDEWLRLQRGSDPLPLFIDDTAAITPLELQSKVAQIGNVDVVIVDYLQIMRGNKSNYKNREAEVSSISRELKAISKHENCHVIALAQLSRETEKRTDPKPRLSDLRESGAIEQDADNIWFIYRPEYYRSDASSSETIEVGHTGIHVPLKGHVTILGEKYRQGSPFQAYLRCDLSVMRFSSGPDGYGSQSLVFDANNYPEMFPDYFKTISDPF